MHLQGCACRLRGEVDGGFGRTSSKHPEVWHGDSLLQDASCQAEETGVPSALDVALQPGWVTEHLECLRVSLGFRLPCVAPEPGAGTHTASILIHVLAIFKP